MFDTTIAQQLQDRPLRGLRFVEKCAIDETALFSLSAQGRSRAQVSLISQHDEKFRLLPVSRVFRHPGRDLLPSDQLVRRAALTAGARRSDGAYRSGGGCNEKQRTKNPPQLRRTGCGT